MNRIIFTIVLLTVGNTILYGQRLIRGQKGFEVTAGFVSKEQSIHSNFYIQAGMTINGKNGNYQLWSAEYSRRTHEFEGYPIPVETILAEGGYSFSLVGDRAKNISLNLGISGVVGYEIINNSKNTLPNGALIEAEDAFVYGAGGRLSLETYLTDHIVLLVQGRAKAIWGTSAGHFRPAAGIGLRYQF
ncbi:conjugal transfer protein TraO [Pedobacter alluvionis]|uniref:Conjugal transfer protein TraO n=1 Tax=Pedobacter alluvionis TaxID=475253 RepID=A0A497Y0W1_9SPHI|nr:conjugal transfer protein TraO [Pedobacter alluvionis]RLJ75114.1 conjugative transposon protein TraO [Pedobacter alluvionis]TFB30218.1 conjugal transfer protein TraO [Pedobacter alluvionis]